MHDDFHLLIVEILRNAFDEISIVNKMCPQKDWNFIHVWVAWVSLKVFLKKSMYQFLNAKSV